MDSTIVVDDKTSTRLVADYAIYGSPVNITEIAYTVRLGFEENGDDSIAIGETRYWPTAPRGSVNS